LASDHEEPGKSSNRNVSQGGTRDLYPEERAKMSEPTIGDNSQLRSVVERIENVNEQIKDLTTDRSDIFKEAKGNGLDIKALRSVIRLRAMNPDDVATQEAILDSYKNALGML
jgi:uncharacterized protein (UPF0335 family)